VKFWFWPMNLINGRKERVRIRTLLGVGSQQKLKDQKPESSFEHNRPEIIRFAGLSQKKIRELYNRIFLCTTICFAFVFIFLSPVPLVPLLVYLLLEFTRLKHLRKKRIREFEKDYPALMLTLSSSLGSGLDPLVALMTAAELFEEGTEMRRALTNTNKDIEIGKTEEEAILGFAIDIPHPDIKLFRTAFIVARKEGASLAPTLQRLTKVTRQRQSFRRKIRTAIAMQKLSAWGIAGCAILISGIQFMMNPTAITAAAQHPVGKWTLVVAGLCLLSGMFWMSRLAKERD